MIECQAALAVFVKTPGLSPIKTRLAEGIGRELAAEFYGLSLAAIEATVATVAESGEICPYWAVAEESGLESPRWQRFARVYQGPGNLGDRLGRAFAELQRRHKIVVAIGADSPQITPTIIREALKHLRRDGATITHVLGRSQDGGFYLFGTNRPLPAKVWHGIPFGHREVANRLAANLAVHGEIAELPVLSDVDHAADLPIVRDELSLLRDPSTKQLALVEWMQEFSHLRSVARGAYSPADSDSRSRG